MAQKIGIQNVYPLTPMQEGMLFHTLLDFKSGDYIEQMVMHVIGDIKKDLLQQSFQSLISRHDVLRTVFRYTNVDKPLQAVLKTRQARLTEEYIGHLSNVEQDAYIRAYRERERLEGFDPSREMPMRLTVFFNAASSCTILLSFHHLILDGWSLGVVLEELFQGYSSLLQGKSPMFEAPFAYSDYFRWLGKRDRTKAVAYWRHALEDFEPVLSLPRRKTDRKKVVETPRQEQFSFQFDAQLTLRLKELAKANEVTLSTLFQTLWGVLLQRYCVTSDIVFGSVVSGRPAELPGIERGVGMFINTIPVRIRDQGGTFAELLQQVNRACMEAVEHEHYPLYEVQAACGLSHPIIDHVVAFENYPLDREKLEGGPDAGYRIAHHEWFEQTNYDFHLIVLPGALLEVKCCYKPDVLEESVVQRLEGHLKQLTMAVLDEPERPVGELDPLTDEERTKLLTAWNQTDADYPSEATLSSLFEAQVARTPGRTAVICGGERLSYSELNLRANRLARILRERGVGPDRLVGLLLGRSADMIVAMLAVLKAGGAYVPIDSDYPLERIVFMLRDSQAQMLIIDDSSAGGLADLEGLALPETVEHVVGVNVAAADDADGENLSPVHGPSNLAYIIYTSGTTGTPKGVMIEHRNVVRLMINDRLPFAFNESDVWTVFHSFCFDFSVWEMYGALLYGGACVVVPTETARSPKAFLELLEYEQVTVLNQTPTAFYALAQEACSVETKRLLNLRYVVFGGEAMQPIQLKAWRAIYPQTKLINMYGITETTVHATYKEITETDMETNLSNIGTPIPTLRCYVFNSRGRLVPEGVAGELYIGGDGVSRGYLNRPELSAERFVANPYNPVERLYKSGDLVRLLENGEMEYIGRIDHQVKIRGYRIETGEIEHRMLQHQAVKEAAVLAVGQGEQKELCAYLVAGGEITSSEVRAFIVKELPEYMAPSYFVQLERMPMTANGKVDRAALPKPEEAGRMKSGGSYAAPRNEIEEKLAELFREVLGVEQVGIHDHFFERGGHSLKATQLVAKIQKQMSMQVPLKRLFAAPTVALLAETLLELEVARYEPIPQAPLMKEYPVSPAQKRILLVDKLEGTGTSYNIPVVLLAEGKLNVQKVTVAFQLLIKRHESLRTTFHTVNEEMVQRIHPVFEQEVPVTEANESEIEQAIAERVKPFDLTQLPLIRIELVKLADNRHLFFLDIHHIVADGTSMGILVKEFTELYGGANLPVLPVQYKDFSVWHLEQLESEVMRRQEAFWYKELEGELPEFRLPTDRQRPAVQSFTGGQIRFELPDEVTLLLRHLAAESGATLYMVLLSIYASLLAQMANQEELLLGTGIAARPHPDLEGLIGMFVNMLVIRSHPKSNKTFRSLLQEMKETSLAAFENQDYPFDLLVETLGLERDPSRNPLFDAAFVLQNMDVPKLELQDVRFSTYDYAYKTSKFDLTLYAWEQGEGLRLLLEYSTALFDEDSVMRLNERFMQLAAEVAHHPDVALGELNLLTTEEETLLARFNDTQHDYPSDCSIPQLFEEQVRLNPGKIAIDCDEERLTYQELDERANRLAFYLIKEHQIGPDLPVGMLIESLTDRIVAVLGILKAGGAYVPIDPDSPQDRVKKILNDAGISVVLTSKKYIKQMNNLQWECPAFRAFLCLDSDRVHEEEEAQRNELMNAALWEFFGEKANDDIEGGYWVNSFTGEYLTRLEMDEYGDNALLKLKPILHPGTKVLEIGCASGISMFRIAPLVGLYYGTDLSRVIIEKDREIARERGLRHIRLADLPAHRIDEIQESGFDIVIINSVIQAFHGHNYLRKVLQKSIDMMSDNGRLFLGDIMDHELKEELHRSLLDYKRQHPEAKTKTDFSEELFVSRKFWQDLQAEMPEIKEIRFSDKIHTVSNELTEYRYDVIIELDKQAADSGRVVPKHRQQHNRSILDRYPTESPAVNAQPHHLAYVIYTSGTTGNPKGVAVEHRNVVRLVKNERYLPFGPEHRFSQTGAISFDASTFEIFAALLNGATLYPVGKETLLDAERFHTFLLRNSINIQFMTTPLFNQLAQVNPHIFGGLEHLLVGGEVLSTKHIRSVREACPDTTIWNVYGPTENTTFSTCLKIERDYEESIPIGMPIGNSSAYILNAKGRQQPIGVPGELCVGGDGVSRGYLNAPALTDEKFVPDPFAPGRKMYRTGDMARRLPDGSIAFIGRIDRQVKVRGHRIELSEVEVGLQQVISVREAAAVVRKDGNGENELWVYFTADKEWGVTDLIEQLSYVLPTFMIPSQLRQLEQMPLTIGGKIDRKALPVDMDNQNVEVVLLPPRTETEKELVRIWQSILGTRRIGVRDRFFDLGGHSLKATVLISRIEKKFGVKMPLRVIFETPTIEEMARYIDEAERDLYEPIPPAPASELYELTPAQSRMFVLNQWQSVEAAYNMPMVWKIEGTLDYARLEHVFRVMIERHESLRTSFEMKDGLAQQRIMADASFQLQIVDVPEEELAAAVQALIRPFALSQAPLLRAAWVRCPVVHGKRTELLAVDMHHIISDGVSMGILMQEFSMVYRGEELELPALPVPYKDYAMWRKSWLDAARMEKLEAYWSQTLEGDVPTLQLPTDYPRPAVQDFAGNRIRFMLPTGMTEAINRMAAQTGTTVYMIMLAAYSVLISKYTGQDDIWIGSPVSGRSHPDVQRTVGMFVNTVVIRTSPSAAKTFGEMLADIKERVLQAQEHQEYPFEQLVELLQPRRDTSRNPLFDTVFSLQNMVTSRMELGDASGRTFPFEFPVAKFDLSLEAIEDGEDIECSLEYRTKLFKRETAETMARAYVRVLEGALLNSRIPLIDIDLINEEERRIVLEHFNDTKEAYPRDMSINELFAEQAEQTPERLAVDDGTERLTYRELNERANRLAVLLRDFGVGLEQPVGLLAGRSTAFVTAVFAVLKAGGAYVPLDPDYPQERIGYMLADSGAKVLLVAPELAPPPSFGGTILWLDASAWEDGSAEELALISAPEHLAYIMYTSGTTGRPKGVMVEHRNVVRLVKNGHYVPFEAESRFAMTGAIGFDAITFELFGALLNGATLYTVGKETLLDEERLHTFLVRNAIHILWLTTSLFNQLAQVNPHMFGSVKHLIVGGEALSAKHIRIVQAACPDVTIWNGYGPTENTTFSTSFRIERTEGEEVSIGRPIGNSTAYIMSREGKLQPIGVPGELCVGGDGVARGYLNTPELTAEKFVADPFAPGGKMYRTGDLAIWEADGTIRYLGRMDRQVKVRGHRIEPAEVEASLRQVPSVRESVVVVREDGQGEKALWGYYTSEEGMTAAELRKSLSGVLPGYMIPARLVRLETMPLTTNGKIDRAALPVEFLEDNGEAPYVAPRTETEAELVRLWQELLDVERISIRDSFFDGGGHSLKAAALIARIHKTWQAELTLSDVFRYSTVESLASAIDHAKKRTFYSIAKAEPKDAYPLSSAQKRIYIQHHLPGAQQSYNMPGILEVSGRFDHERLKQAFKQLIQRHESLRTRFEIREGELMQIVLDDVQFDIPVTEAAEPDAARLIASFIRPFELSEAPLMRVELFQLETERHLLLFDMHHIISDGTSMEIFINEFTKLYEGSELPELPLQYKDYAVWQNQFIASDKFLAQAAYWEQALEDRTPRLELPTNKPRPAVRSYEGGSFLFHADEKLADSLKELAAKQNATLYIVLLGAYMILLSAKSKQDNLLVGTPVAGRPHVDLAGLVGMFVNTLLIHGKPHNGKTITEFLQEIKETAFSAFENQDYPFELLAETYRTVQESGRSPLFDTMFALQNAGSQSFRFLDVELKPYVFEANTAKFDLMLEAMETEYSSEERKRGAIRFRFEYSSSLFALEMISRLADEYMLILKFMTERPEAKLGNIPIGFMVADRVPAIPQEISFDF